MTIVAGLMVAAAVAAFVPENKARVAEIAAMLPEKPAMADPDYAANGNRNRINAARRVLKKDVPAFPNDLYLEFTTTGNRTHFQDWRGRFLNDLELLVDAEAAERKGRLVPGVAARLDAICAWPSWVLPAHDRALTEFRGQGHYVDLVSSDLARYLARVLWAIGEELPAETVARVRREVNERVFRPYLEKPEKMWWFLGGNNWNAVCHAGCVIAALSMIEDRTTRARFVEGAERASKVYMEMGFDPDGYCSEGMGYWNYGFGKFLDLGIAVRKATGGKVDYFSHPRAVMAMRYPFSYQLAAGIAPKFADGAGNPKSSVVARGLTVWPELKPLAEAALPVRSVFPDGQVWVMRMPAGSPVRFALALKGGHNAEKHNHNDVGTYDVLADGEFLTGDVGGEVYTERTFSPRRYESKVLNSYGHPVPQVGGELQKTGREACAKVVRTDFTDAADTVVLDLAAAYDCPTLETLERTFVFDRANAAVTVTDRVRFSAPTDFESPLMTFNPDLLAGRWSVEATGGAWEKVEEKLDNPGCPTPCRTAIRFKAPVAEATVSFTFTYKKD